MRYLIAGGCSFIGSAVIATAVARGDQVLNVDRRPKSRPPERLAALARSSLYVQFEGDASDRRLMRSITREFAPDAVLHVVDAATSAAEEIYDARIGSMFALLEAVRDLESRRAADAGPTPVVIHFAARALLAATSGPDAAEGGAAARIAAEQTGFRLATDWAAALGVQATPALSGDAFGCFEPADGPVARLVSALVAGRDLAADAAGCTMRDWIAVEDVADGLLAALSLGGPAGGGYAFTACVERRDREFAEAVATILDARAPRPDGQSHVAIVARMAESSAPSAGLNARPPILDPSAAEGRLGWSPQPFHTRLGDAVDSALASAGMNPTRRRQEAARLSQAA